MVLFSNGKATWLSVLMVSWLQFIILDAHSRHEKSGDVRNTSNNYVIIPTTPFFSVLMHETRTLYEEACQEVLHPLNFPGGRGFLSSLWALWVLGRAWKRGEVLGQSALTNAQIVRVIMFE